MSEKNILEQALLQINTLEEAVKQNAKGILASTMKEELKDLLKESLEEEDEEVKESAEVSEDETMEDEVTESPMEEDEKDMSDEEDSEEEEEADADDDSNLDNEVPADDVDSDDEDSDDEFGSESGMDSDNDMDFGGGVDDEVDSDDDVMDMTGASDEEVIKVFKKMKPEDGIVVKKDGNTVEFQDGENNYVIKLDENEVSEDETLYEISLDEEDDEVDEDEMEEGGNAPYEDEVHEGDNAPYEKKVGVHESKNGPFEKKAKVKKDVHEEGGDPYSKKAKVSKDVHEEDEQMEEGEDSPFDKKAGKKVQADEAARTKSNPHGDKGGADRAGLKSKKMYKAGSDQKSSVNEEVESLKKQNAEYKKALALFKDKLNEVAVFNANLAYATRLFTENSTTKQEKLNILKRFDSVSTLQESKSLYTTIQTELTTKTTTVVESVAEKISNTPQTSSSQEVLSESKAYENPQFARMRDLMKKVK